MNKIPVAFTPFFDSLLGLSGNAGEGNGLKKSCARVRAGGHNNTEINPVFRGML